MIDGTAFYNQQLLIQANLQQSAEDIKQIIKQIGASSP